MTKNEMMDNMMKRFGFENEITIQFCELAESKTYPKECLETVYKVLMETEIEEEEEEEE